VGLVGAEPGRPLVQPKGYLGHSKCNGGQRREEGKPSRHRPGSPAVAPPARGSRDPEVRPRRAIRENFDVFDFELSGADMEAIGSLDEQKGLFVRHEDPEIVKRLNGWKIHD
jgi:hypothetical protein